MDFETSEIRLIRTKTFFSRNYLTFHEKFKSDNMKTEVDNDSFDY